MSASQLAELTAAIREDYIRQYGFSPCAQYLEDETRAIIALYHLED